MTAPQSALDAALADMRNLSKQITALVTALTNGAEPIAERLAVLDHLVSDRNAAEDRFDAALAEATQ